MVNEFAVEHAPSAHVVIQVPTFQGHRYRIEQSATMTHSWDVSSCAAEDIVTGTDGVFIGTGNTVSVRVPCSADEGQMYFRVRDLSLD